MGLKHLKNVKATSQVHILKIQTLFKNQNKTMKCLQTFVETHFNHDYIVAAISATVSSLAWVAATGLNLG